MMNYETSPFLTVAKWVLLLLVLTPFIVDRNVFFPFIEGKVVLLRAVATLSLILLVIFLLFGKYSQRQEFLSAKLKLLKSPISILMALFLVTAAISTVFAKDSFRAFFGTVERGEGFIGLLFFTLIFYLFLLLFSQKEWRLFFVLVSASGIVFFLHQISQLGQEGWFLGSRPFASFGNPSLLAGYYLFVIFSGFVLLAEKIGGSQTSSGKSDFKIFTLRKSNFLNMIFGKSDFWIFILSAASILAAVIGIFLTQTRGTYLGFAAGLVIAGFYLIWILTAKYKLAKILIPAGFALILLVGAAGGILFIARGSLPSEDAEAAREGPALFSQINRRLTETGALQTRLIAAGVSLRSIDPRNEGFDRFLFGWGPDNYNIAYNTYFDPRYFIYEDVWFDRAHNKVLDTLVMQGFFGMLIFLGIWGVALWLALRFNTGKSDFPAEVRLPKHPLVNAAFLFFAVSYFVHDLFLFDSPATGVALSAFFAFVVYIANTDSYGFRRINADTNKNKNRHKPAEIRINPRPDIRINQPKSALISVLASSLVIVAAIAAIILFFWTTWGPYLQMKKYIGMKTGNLTIKEFTAKLDQVFYPYNYVQEVIRIDLLKSLPDLKSEEGIGQLAAKTFEAVDELIEREPYEPRHSMNMGQVLEKVAGRPEFYERAELYYRKALALVPNRPDLLYLLAQNLFIQGKMQEAQEPLDKLFEQSKEIPKSGVLYGAALIYASEEYQASSFAVLESSLRAMDDLARLGSALPVMQMIYNDFLAEFAQKRDEKNFLAALETAIRVEETWEKSQEEQLRLGKIKELPWEKEGAEKKSVLYKRILERFPKEGWGLVEVKE